MLRKIRVLVVDNQARARKSMRALLEAWHQNQEVHEAASGTEAVRMAQEFLPDIILMDARMPGMNGLQAAQLIKAGRPQTRIVVLSMHSELEAEALSAGADAFVSKSDPPEILREILMKFSQDVQGTKEENNQ